MQTLLTQHMQESNRTVEARDAQIARLGELLNTAQEDYRRALEEHREAQDHHGRAEEELAAAEHFIAEFKGDAERAHARASEQQTKAAELQARLVEAQRQLAELERHKTVAEARADDFAARLSQVERSRWLRAGRALHLAHAKSASNSPGRMERSAFVLARSVYRRLPLPADLRTRAKNGFYGRFGALFKHTQNYQLWHMDRSARRVSTTEPVRPEPLARQPPAAMQPLTHGRHARSVSVIIPAWGKLDLTRQCIEKVRSAGSAVPIEILVVDDGSPEPLANGLPNDDIVRVLRLDENSGFIAACNHGALNARGSHLMFLNNDAEVSAGAIDAMLDTFDEHPNAGIVGCKLVFPDGRLQEAGAFIARDGTAQMVGLWDDPSRARYDFVRGVGYSSGACLMIRRETFLDLGGFGSGFAPAYCEDSDLCSASARRACPYSISRAP